MESIGRNDPCPCRSGKKYKKCCLEADARRNPNGLTQGSGKAVPAAVYEAKGNRSAAAELFQKAADLMRHRGDFTDESIAYMTVPNASGSK